ncbi:unnamed protein product [Microthlaspi erraticum]|uniref:MATH domain-containing protein n=1 Tax=Microthlaspi erraticum TaxID=1685480 RepID=A0A6D2KUU9_9BRAS|nr:unnamed protein product [Microthlaspi erraticum]
MIPLTKLHNETEGFLVNGELIVAAEVEVLEVISTSVESEISVEASEPLSEMNLDDGSKSCDCLNNAQQVNEKSIDVNGFQVLPSQLRNLYNAANFSFSQKNKRYSSSPFKLAG